MTFKQAYSTYRMHQRLCAHQKFQTMPAIPLSEHVKILNKLAVMGKHCSCVCCSQISFLKFPRRFIHGVLDLQTLAVMGSTALVAVVAKSLTVTFRKGLMEY